MEGSAAGGSDLRRDASRLSECGGGLRRVILEMFCSFLFNVHFSCLQQREWFVTTPLSATRVDKKNAEAPQILINLVKDERIQKGIGISLLFCRIKLRREPKSIPEITNMDEARSPPSSLANSSSSAETSASSPLAPPARVKRNAEFF